MKRARRSGDTLTGGTKDVNPQWFKLRAVESAVNTGTTVQVALPVTRFSSRSGKSIIIEVLSIKWIIDPTQFLGGVGAGIATLTIGGTLTTKSFGTNAIPLTDGTIIDYFETAVITAFSGGGSVATIVPSETIHDTSDGAGHGLLIATDNVYLQVSSANTGAAAAVNCWLLYRFKEVDLEEYVGIVQSQQ